MIRNFTEIAIDDRAYLDTPNGMSTGTVIARREDHIVVLWDGLAGQMTYTDRDIRELGIVFTSI